MPVDKYTAVWVSHSSIGDYLKCPRAYFLKNVYKNPKTGHKIKLMSPPLALGQAVHEVLEDLSVLPTKDRFKESLLIKFSLIWEKLSGKLGGFLDENTEYKYKERGRDMLTRVAKNPGPLLNPALKINMDLPQFWLSEEDNIILCGKIDWLEYLPDTDTVHIIDFKTSRSEEDPSSLQLPIYHLLVRNCQKREASKASYWYLDHSDIPEEKPLPNLEESREKVLKISKQIKLARQMQRFLCPHNGCPVCLPFESIINNEAEFVGHDNFGADVFIRQPQESLKEDSIIL